MKKVILIILAIICIFFCAICALNGSLELYTVYVGEKESDILYDEAVDDIPYKELGKTYSLPKIKQTKKWIVKDRSLTIGAATIELSYNMTYNKEYSKNKVDSFEDEKYGITAEYGEDNGKLEYLNFGDYKYKLLDKPVDNEETLVEACSEYLSLQDIDLDGYGVSVETLVRVSSENGTHYEKIGKFAQPQAPDGSTYKSTYTVTYKRFIGGVPTAEFVSVRVDSEGFLKTFSTYMVGEYEDFLSCEIDMERCNEAISSAVYSMCDIEEYEFEGYSDTQLLICLDGKLCLLSFVEPKYKSPSPDFDIFPPQIELIIPVAE